MLSRKILSKPVALTFSRSLSTTPQVYSGAKSAQTLLQDNKNGFGFIRSNPRPPKPRKVGVTEIRGPYYSIMGKRYLKDVLETMGHHVDGLKFAGGLLQHHQFSIRTSLASGSFSLLPEERLRELIELAHENSVYVSTV
jgi:phosphosulfolactate synthase (CoM biosynthesis protein A)